MVRNPGVDVADLPGDSVRTININMYNQINFRSDGIYP